MDDRSTIEVFCLISIEFMISLDYDFPSPRNQKIIITKNRELYFTRAVKSFFS